jgi:hypothetical protein
MAFVPIGAHRSARHKGVVDRLRESGATRRDRARPLPEIPRGSRWYVDRLIDQGVIRPGASGLYYVDEDALRDQRARQRAIAFSALVIIAAISVGVALTASL